METVSDLTATDYARIALDVASDKQASDIVMLDIRGICDFADYFVVLSVDSDRQMDSLSVDIEKELERRGATLHHREGTSAGGWLLLDFIDVVIHLFRVDQRDFYRLEDFWSRGIETVRIQ